MIEPVELMRLAIKKAIEGIDAGQSPFGCTIARGDDVLAISHNTVVATTDITAHAEINALRLGCKTTGQIHLEGCIVATTCEPCPMCMAALHWARVETVYFGASIADADAAGFNELQVPAADVLKIGGSKVALVGDVLSAECRDLFKRWLERSDRIVY
ncbi:MAG: nucleoside deaminase [Planctomycetaceae bacterium]|nr:nucleoside deaminase [Planctomycetales bacterium]MCB9920823.1 nucleoside deaminase [Planctomycetaceae bacterium]